MVEDVLFGLAGVEVVEVEHEEELDGDELVSGVFASLIRCFLTMFLEGFLITSFKSTFVMRFER